MLSSAASKFNVISGSMGEPRTPAGKLIHHEASPNICGVDHAEVRTISDFYLGLFKQRFGVMVAAGIAIDHQSADDFPSRPAVAQKMCVQIYGTPEGRP
jgi:hypothetical protein